MAERAQQRTVAGVEPRSRPAAAPAEDLFAGVAPLRAHTPLVLGSCRLIMFIRQEATVSRSWAASLERALQGHSLECTQFDCGSSAVLEGDVIARAATAATGKNIAFVLFYTGQETTAQQLIDELRRAEPNLYIVVLADSPLPKGVADLAIERLSYKGPAALRDQLTMMLCAAPLGQDSS